MTDKTSYPQGEFCWAELTTSDGNGAKHFYTSMFGWAADEVPMAPGEPPYVMLRKDGKDAAALYENKKLPPHWASYVAVKSADEIAKKAKSLGGKVVAEPFDVMDVGRMAVIQDPQSATFCIWQAGRHIGAKVVGEPNTMCWNELMTEDIESARKFYSALFGWKPKISPGYTEMLVGDTATGGMMQITEEMKGMPSHWWPYFAVADCDASTKKVQSLGGKLHMGPQDIPDTGRFAVLEDPQGAWFNIIHLNPRR